MEAIKHPNFAPVEFKFFEDGEKPDLFEMWNPAKGRFTKPSAEAIFEIDKAPPEIRTELIVAHAFELAGLIKSHDQLHTELEILQDMNSRHLDDGMLFLANRKAKELSKDIYIEHEVRHKITEAHDFVNQLSYTQLSSRLPELTAKESPSIKIINSMASGNLIGPVIRRSSTGIIRTLIGWHKNTLPTEPSRLE